MLTPKARTLERLATAGCESFVVDPFLTFPVSDWICDPDAVLRRVCGSGLGETVVVRSSALAEDVDPSVPPGMFHTELDLVPMARETMRQAIERVVTSYGRHRPSSDTVGSNEVIVQRQLTKCRLSGVVDTGSSAGLYMRVQYDDETGRTETITGGRACKRVELWRGPDALPEPWQAVRQAVVDVERILPGCPLMVEFAVSYEGRVHVFQARAGFGATPTSMPARGRDLAVRSLRGAELYVRGQPGPWSDMADWNPAEMLGDRPKPLATSLYRYLVTDSAWARGRASLGYRRVRPSILLETIAGKPYIDVCRSFLSLTPEALTDDLATRLTDDRVRALRECPHLHDKVEFDILFTVADVRRPRRTECLRERGFSRGEVAELEARLGELTAQALERQPSLLYLDCRDASRLVDWCKRNRPDMQRADHAQLQEFMRRALRRCRDLGVVPFARQARLAFMARDLLAGLSAAGCVPDAWLQAWWGGMETVAFGISQAIVELAAGRLPRDQFDARFGHLRARTYDICSPRYDQIAEFAGQPVSGRTSSRAEPPPAFGGRCAERCLRRAGLHTSAPALMAFARESMKAREQIKFMFSAVVSDILEAAAALGGLADLAREDVAFLCVNDLTRTRDTTRWEHVEAEWRSRIAEEREAHSASLCIALPDLILSADDLMVVPHHSTRPNFITQAVITADVVVLDGATPDAGGSLDGKIIVIEAADPGFDWVFAFSIAGLVTRYGGTLSHMAVRCSEFGIPAAIGCGDELYGRAARAKSLRLDCAEQRIEAVGDVT